MSDPDLAFRNAAELVAGYRRRDFRAVDVVANAIARAEEVNPSLNCFTEIYADEALEVARARDRDLEQRGLCGPLHGVPVAIKDVTPIAGKRTTLGSHVFADHVAASDAVVVERLRAAGAIILGHTTTAELAFSGFTATSLWGVTRNPWDPERTSGGSSGGSAVAVASGCVPLAEGTDMGGSIRAPASYCGILGMKPSLGRIPLDFIPTQFDSIAHTGPLGRTAEDIALFLDACSGSDDRDIQSLPKVVIGRPDGRVAGQRIAVSLDLGYYAVSEGVAANTLAAADLLRDAGAVTEPVELGWTVDVSDAWMTYWKVYLAAFYGAHLDRWRDRMHPDLVRWMDEGMAVTATELRQTELLRAEQWRRLAQIFARFDVLLCPTTTVTAPLASLTDSDFETLTPEGRSKGPELTLPFNFVSQCPVISVPSGLGRDGLPTGVQVVGRRHDDRTPLQVAAALAGLAPDPVHLARRAPSS